MRNLTRHSITGVREGRKGLEKARATEAMPRVRERSRWFKPRPARWGIGPHRVAEARGETPVAGLLSDVCAYRLRSSSAARQMCGYHGFHAHAHLKLKRKRFKNSRVRSFWCGSRPVAPRTRRLGSTCPCRVAPCCYLWEIQFT